MSNRVGIDFGTSNSGVAIFDGNQVKLLPIDQSNVMPEVVKTILYITRDHKAYIGQEAVALYYKHNIGRLRRYVRKWAGELDIYGADMHYVDDVYVLEDELKPGRLLQFLKTALHSKSYRGTQIFDRFYSIEEIIAVYLLQLKKRTEVILNDTIDVVTLGRPVKFSDDPDVDRRSEMILRQAAYLAGFKRVNFEFEPVAAALYYEMTIPKPQDALIFDFGGGTLDITILHLGDPNKRDIYASGGINIAGSDFDRTIIEKRMLNYFGLGQIFHQPEIQELILAITDWMALPDLSTPHTRVLLEQAIKEKKATVHLKALETLIFNDLAFSFYNAIESAKIELSSQGATIINIIEKNLNIWELYTRFQFEKDIHEQTQQIEEILLKTLTASGLETGQIDVVVKTGGSSSIPVFTNMLERIFNPQKVISSDVFMSVTAGLAISAYQGIQ